MSVTVAVRGTETGDSFEEVLHDSGVVLAARETAADLVLAVGDVALCSLADDPAPVPALPVATSVGRHGVAREAVGEVLGGLSPAALDGRVVPHPVLSADVAGDEARGLLDVALVTSEPAHISEYTVADASGVLGSFRADGVVVATPAGSAGYSHATGGPLLAAETGLAVVPVSPYTTKPRTWVVDDPVTLDVERDESPVSLVVDGRARRQVTVDEPVRLTVDRTVDLLRPPLPADGARRLEKL
ncbi:NAD(+)/NADH kinase [Salinigranum halophilum]|uniref:NAD(+)/NADH kinase n=1 Tax=Salinigranum halophilum TaxID=2565931 RepID=UPI00137634EA|nr:NAD(+)/NADH kinase [Salinigranum halophilum]